MNAKTLTFAESRNGDVCVVSLAGRIDSANAGELTRRLSKLLSSGEKSIVVDLGAVLYLTSAAFRALLIATDEAERNEAKFVLCNVAGPAPDHAVDRAYSESPLDEEIHHMAANEPGAAGDDGDRAYAHAALSSFSRRTLK